MGSPALAHFDMVDLRLFLYVVETSSVRRGAERACLSAPAASARIKHVEELIGTALFERTSKGMSLTTAGHAFLYHAKRMLSQLDELGRDMQAYTHGVKGHVRVAANPTVVAEYMPGVIRSYLDKHPDIRVDLRERFSAEIVRMVSTGTADFGVISGHVHLENLEVRECGFVRLALAVSTQHPLASRDRVTFAECLAYDQIGFQDVSPTYPFLNLMSASLRFPLTMRVQAASVDALCRMVEADIGIGVVPEPSARRFARSGGIKVLSLDDDLARFTLLICARSFDKLPPHSQEMVDMITGLHIGSGEMSALPR
ncbi:MAG: LysR substrate-binding domain-containing protein [Burkholderiaceae bacterium]|nr:LysR substrate-binding domain-containing protein [Burkholderiaceae bacterium]